MVFVGPAVRPYYPAALGAVYPKAPIPGRRTGVPFDATVLLLRGKFLEKAFAGGPDFWGHS